MKHTDDAYAIGITNSGAHYELVYNATTKMHEVYRTCYEGEGFIRKVAGRPKSCSAARQVAAHNANLVGVEIVEFISAK